MSEIERLKLERDKEKVSNVAEDNRTDFTSRPVSEKSDPRGVTKTGLPVACN